MHVDTERVAGMFLGLGLVLVRDREETTSGAKAHVCFGVFVARLKSCPFKANSRLFEAEAAFFQSQAALF
jgi:hypothetical protein